jgi:two-component system chemotaxis response regulator CheY
MKENQKILIVDDSLLGRISIKNSLESYNFTLLEASDGHEALDLIRKEEPNLVFLDLLMPNLGGVGVLKALKEEGKEQNVIIVSADIQETTKRLCLDLGAKDFANKPVEENKMDFFLKKYLGWNKNAVK